MVDRIFYVPKASIDIYKEQLSQYAGQIVGW
jgi:hypothetical protein